MSFSSSSMRNFNRQLQKMADAAGEAAQSSLVSQARLFCVDMAAETLPKVEKKGGTLEQARDKVAARIGQIYKPVGWAVEALNRKDPGIGYRFGEAVKRRRFAEADSILTKTLGGVSFSVGTFDGGRLHKAQESTRVIRKVRVVTNFASVEVYMRKKKRMVGFAKGGFAAAARNLGGVRGIPGYATRQKSPGKAYVQKSATKTVVVIENHVKHIDAALPKGAEERVYAKRTAAMQKAMQAQADRKIKKAMKGSQQ